MDDSCFCFAAEDPLTLERKAANLCGLLLQRCKSYAMTPKLQPGKTAVLLVFQGKGAAAARKKHFGPTADPGLPVLLEGGVQRVHMCIWVVSCIIEEICDKKPADATASLKGLFNNIGKYYITTSSYLCSEEQNSSARSC